MENYSLARRQSQQSERAQERLQRFVELVPVLALLHACPRHSARIRAERECAGTPIGANDLWIATHALAARLILVNSNLREFSRIPDLAAENWAH